MAKFGESFLAQLGSPAMSQSLFGLGSALGGIPGQLKEQRRKQEQLKRYDQIAQISEQGIASAQSGDVANVTSRIEQLQQTRENAKTLEEKQAIGQSILKLQSLLPGAKQVAIGNNAKELVNIEQKLKSLPAGSTPQRLALQKRQEVLQQDPEAMRQYQQYQLDSWKFQQAEEEMQAEQWLDSNRGSMLEAIESGNTDQLNTIIEGAGVNTEAAQKFVNISLQSAENMAKFEENSMERKIAPSVDYYTEQVNSLPEEIQNNLKSTLEAYTRVSNEGWDGKQWNTGARISAKQLEKNLQSQLRAINIQIATSEYFNAKREERATKEQIKKIEIKLDAPMGSDYITQGRIMAQSLLKKGEELTENDIMAQATALYKRDQNQLIQELASLTGEEPVEEEEVKENKDSPYRIINGRKLSLSEVKEDVKEFGETEVRRLLKEQGATEEDIAFYFTSEPTEREKRMKALGPRDERMDAIGTGFVARTDALGPRAERMKSLGPREERMVSLFN
jgi:hypothetical protein